MACIRFYKGFVASRRCPAHPPELVATLEPTMGEGNIASPLPVVGLADSKLFVFCCIFKHQKEIASGKGQKHHADAAKTRGGGNGAAPMVALSQ